MPKKLKVNPWIGMWTEPRSTIRHIVKFNPAYMVIPIAAFLGIFDVLDQASMKASGDYFGIPAIFLMAALMGPFIGIAQLYIGAWLLSFTGKWIGGKASTEHLRTAIAWGSVPFLWFGALWIPELVIFGKELFTSSTPLIDSSPVLSILLVFFGLVEIVGIIWGFVVYLKAVGEVQKFSAWKALLNTLLVAGVAISVAAVLIALFLLVAA